MMEYLPFEVLEVIATYLSAEDLTRCLGVSRTWYKIFSDDFFWKRHCLSKLDNYLATSKCLVEPGFKLQEETLLSVERSRLQFLQEQHLWKNWDAGRFKEEIIQFYCDDSYNMTASFLDNNHVCLHRTLRTEVWNVAETPFVVMTIPYCLKELWLGNVYKIINNSLIVVQCNVVQVYKICLGSKSWSLSHVFFFNKPEEFSSGITTETDVLGLFQHEATSDDSHFELVICGEYFVGSYKGEESPHLHIWNLQTGKKIKEDTCEICKGAFSIELMSSRKKSKNVLVTFKLDLDMRENLGESCSVVYDLSKLQFLLPTQHYHSGIVMYFDGSLSAVHDDSLKLFQHFRIPKNETISELTTCLPKCLGTITSIQPLDANLLISNRKELFLINTSEMVSTQNSNNVSCVLKVDFSISHMDVLFNRYVVLHDRYQSIKEVWKIGKSLRKVIEFPSYLGICVARNTACSKIVLKRTNNLIVLNFW